MITVLQLDEQFGGGAHERRGRAGGHTGPPLHAKMETRPPGVATHLFCKGRCPHRPAGRCEYRSVGAGIPDGPPTGAGCGTSGRPRPAGRLPEMPAGGNPPPYGRQSASFVGADIIRPPCPYRKLLPKLNSACFPKRAGAFGSPAGGFHILGGSKFRLRQGFAGRNAWTPHSGGSLRSQEQAGRRYRKLLPKLNSACSLVSSPMV